MSLPREIRAVLTAATLAAWGKLVPLVPAGAYLVGGTAVACYLRHRTSRDLDFFVAEPFDGHALEARLHGAGEFGVTFVADGTVNGVFDRTKVQFLLAHDQVQLRPSVSVGGLEVASLEDLQATKLRAVGARGELRDYFDLMEMERRAGLRVERGLGLYVARYRPSDAHNSVAHIVGALGYLGDVGDDPGLPVSRREVERYWRRRQPEISRLLAMSFYGAGRLSPDVRVALAGEPSATELKRMFEQLDLGTGGDAITPEAEK